MYKEVKYRIANSILNEKNKAGGLTLAHFNIYYKATLINRVKNKNCGIGERIGKYTNGANREPLNRPHKYRKLISDKGARIIKCSTDSLFNKWY